MVQEAGLAGLLLITDNVYRNMTNFISPLSQVTENVWHRPNVATNGCGHSFRQVQLLLSPAHRRFSSVLNLV